MMTPQEIKEAQERAAKTRDLWQKLTAESDKFKAMFADWSFSKRLKAVGFDEPCFGYYWFTKDTFHYTIKYENHNNMESRVSAPLLQQVVDWFDSKRIYIDIDHEFGEDWTFCVDNGGNGHSGDEVVYTSRKEATLYAIDVALKILETNSRKITTYRD